MIRQVTVLYSFLLAFLIPALALAAEANPLAIGRAAHAFDHLGDIGEQSAAASAAGCNILYTTGVGSLGYAGLPPPEEFKAARDKTANQRK